MIRLAVVGLGGRSKSLVSLMRTINPDITLRAVVDNDKEAATERCKSLDIDPDKVRWFDSIAPWLEEADEYDAVLIGTQCNTHTPLAIQVAQTGLPLLLEKPVAVTAEQLHALHAAYKDNPGKVVVCFGLRFTPLFRTALEIVQSGRLGVINQIRAFNQVPYGAIYYMTFYREQEISHGLWLQKATHDFDYMTLLAGSKPTCVAATSTRKIFGGNKPHSLRCSQCDETDTCLYSPQTMARTQTTISGVDTGDHLCVYGKNIQLQDAGSALIEYKNGINTSYTQNFVSRRIAACRGAVVTGSDATLEFDWYTKTIRVIEHYKDREDVITISATTGHMGGDTALINNFLDVIAGRDESFAPLTTGLLSAAMCLAANTSCKTRQFESIPLVDEF